MGALSSTRHVRGLWGIGNPALLVVIGNTDAASGFCVGEAGKNFFDSRLCYELNISSAGAGVERGGATRL
jgi:hypothetical protein